MKALFVVEGFTDIRFVRGLSEISELSLLVPSRHYHESGLDQRIKESGTCVSVETLEGGRVQYQVSCFAYLWKRAKDFDVILSQEVLRGSLNATLAGRIRNIPVVTYMCLAPVEYYRCRRERRQIGLLKSFAGETVIRSLMAVNGKLATRSVALGEYLHDLSSRYSSRTRLGLYYGVDTEMYCPADDPVRTQLRRDLKLPLDKFVIFFSSRISHEKDPETVLHAAALARARGLDAVVLNLGGSYREFLNLAQELSLKDSAEFVIGRPAAHPMKELPEYYRAADCMALASLAEGLGMSPLEAMACGTPAVCTAVGGLARNLKGYARLTPKRDPAAMADEFLWIAGHRDQARAQALSGREFVIREWSRQKAFSDLAAVFADVCK